MKLSLAQLFVGCIACAATAETLPPALIPLPREMTVQEGLFHLDKKPVIAIESDATQATANILAARLYAGTGYTVNLVFPAATTPGVRVQGITLSTRGADPALGPEGYELTVTPQTVVISAHAEAGLFYGIQTLLQLFPPDIMASQPLRNESWTIPCIHIRDQPRFAWRGLMLDVSRHFYTKAEVEQILDAMAFYKLNTFHFHLVDDPGWRIEIKKYPRLTAVDAWRNGIDYGLDPKSSTAYRADGKYGGFYTQKDIRELVRYAAERHITIVPEIEMPGHSAGALSAYPEYSCTGGPFSLDGDDAIFCPGNEQTFTFLENILTEVMDLFPGPFIHVGGDEVSTKYWENCPKCQARMKTEGLKNERQLESYLIQRIEKFINAHGKRLIGWSEIRQGGLAKNAAIMDWIGGATESAREGHDVVMSPTGFCYLDYYQSRDQSAEPKAIGGFLPLQRVYQFEPMPAKLAPEYQSHILGGQGNLWTEFIPNLRHAEYMIFPRECAMAEVLWSPKNLRNWNGFLSRLKVNELRLDAMGVNYRRNPTSTGEK
jgi:hexosaminidase